MKTVLRVSDVKKRAWQAANSIHTSTASPAVNHGVKGCRQVVEALDTPLQVRHGTPDARLLTEITYAGGFTSYEGGGISYNIPYAKNIPIEQTMKRLAVR